MLVIIFYEFFAFIEAYEEAFYANYSAEFIILKESLVPITSYVAQGFLSPFCKVSRSIVVEI